MNWTMAKEITKIRHSHKRKQAVLLLLLLAKFELLVVGLFVGYKNNYWLLDDCIMNLGEDTVTGGL